MKFHAATLKNNRLLVGIFNDKKHTFPAGTEVTAVQLDNNTWHLNAELCGEMYDGYANTSMLNLGDVIGTVNE